MKAHEEKLKEQETLKRAGLDLEQMGQRVCQNFKIELDEIFRTGRANDISMTKNLIAYIANKKLGISGAEIAQFFGVSRSAVSYCIQRGEKSVQEIVIDLIPYSTVCSRIRNNELDKKTSNDPFISN